MALTAKKCRLLLNWTQALGRLVRFHPSASFIAIIGLCYTGNGVCSITLPPSPPKLDSGKIPHVCLYTAHTAPVPCMAANMKYNIVVVTEMVFTPKKAETHTNECT